MSTLTWAAQELRTADLGDGRRTTRLIRVAAALAGRPRASVPEACGGDWAATKATYRLWASPRVTPEAIRAAHRARTVARLAGRRTVLAVQDTTELDFTRQPAIAGLGPLDKPWERGLKVHSALAVGADGVPLGLLHQRVWARDPAASGQKHERKRRATAEKESQPLAGRARRRAGGRPRRGAGGHRGGPGGGHLRPVRAAPPPRQRLPDPRDA